MILRLAEFFGDGNVMVLTGAGAGVESEIWAYQGNDGRYTNPNYKCVALSRDMLVLFRPSLA
jgi:NAD-dependent SIR2 family protein deacetylase